MKTRELSALRQQAEQCGVQTEFTDASGQLRRASVETLRSMIELFRAKDPAPAPLPPVIVCWNGQPKTVPFSNVSGSRAKVSLFSREACDAPPPALALTNRGGPKKLLHLPALPFGYHEIHVELKGTQHRSLLISAPPKAFHERGMRTWGVFIPMYAAHSERSWGAGNLSDWQTLVEKMAALEVHPRQMPGARSRNNVVLATLPLMGGFLDEWKYEPSPYSPATRLFWNEFYLDILRVPEFASSPRANRLVNSSAFQNEIAALRKGDLVDYQREMRLKRRVLEMLASQLFHRSSTRQKVFETFLKQRPELERYAAFRATCEKRKTSWHSWPERLRAGRLRHGDYDADVLLYHQFAQWLVQEQMEAVLRSSRAHGAKLYLDLPLGVNGDGYDVWANQHLFVTDASVGAPPDLFFTKGQDWGFPPLNPHSIRADGYRYVIDYLRFQMRHTGLLRLDHVMGLHRLWWVPRGASAADGAYVRYSADELYAILCVESHRHQTMLVGENLGTVPPEVNRSMKRHGLSTMYVAQYEVQPNAKEPMPEPPRRSVASINTHDMPMWCTRWKGLDIADRKQLGTLTPEGAREERMRRTELHQILERFLRRKKLLAGRASTESVLAALVKFLAKSNAEVVLLNLEDLWLETRPQNTPGTCAERVNWRRKARFTIEQLMSRRGVVNLLKIAASRGRSKQ